MCRFGVARTEEEITFLYVQRNNAYRGDGDILFYKFINLCAVADSCFHFAGGIEFAKNTSAKLARDRTASIFSGAAKTDSPVMYTAMVGINVYPSSRNFNYFLVLAGLSDAPGRRVLAD